MTDRLISTCQLQPSSIEACSLIIPGSFVAPNVSTTSFNLFATGLDGNPSVFNNVSMPVADVFVYWSPTFYGTQNITYEHDIASFVAYELSLAFCVQTLQTGVVNGIATTSIQDIQTEFQNTTSEELIAGMLYNDTLFSTTAQFGISEIMDAMFNGDFVVEEQGAFQPDSTVGVRAFREAVESADVAGLERVWQNVATSMTNE